MLGRRPKKPDPYAAETANLDAQLGDERKRRDQYANQLLAPPPAPRTADVDPLESLIGAFAGLATQGDAKPYALAAPGIAARQRAAEGTQFDQQAFKSRQDALGSLLGSQDRIIGGLYDRKSIVDKMRADKEKQAQQNSLRERLAQISSDVQVAKSIAHLGQDANPETLKPLLALTPYGKGLDEESLNDLAYQTWQNANLNPSFRMQIELAKRGTADKAQAQKQVKDQEGEYDKAIQDGRKASALRIAVRLSQVEGSRFFGDAPELLQAQVEEDAGQSLKAAQSRAQTEATQAKAKSEQERAQSIAAARGLDWAKLDETKRHNLAQEAQAGERIAIAKDKARKALASGDPLAQSAALKELRKEQGKAETAYRNAEIKLGQHQAKLYGMKMLKGDDPERAKLQNLIEGQKIIMQYYLPMTSPDYQKRVTGGTPKAQGQPKQQGKRGKFVKGADGVWREGH